jgi:hypothetical protein
VKDGFSVWCSKLQKYVWVKGRLKPGRLGNTQILTVEACEERGCPYRASVDCKINHEIEGVWNHGE